MNRLFRWGILIALLVLLGSGVMALRIVFVADKDITVPSLVGLTAEEASSRLESLGLPARIDLVDSEQPDGTVISQAFAPGEKLEKGKIVNIRVSRGGAKLQIPDVRGMTFAEAAKTLDSLGFSVGNVLRVTDPLKPAGTVIAQNPAAPAMVMKSRMVELLVCEGQAGKNEMVQVPDLIGQTEKLARQIVEQSNLTVSNVIYVDSSAVPSGCVSGSQPRAGVRVPFGGAVVLHIAGGDATTGSDSTETATSDEAATQTSAGGAQPDQNLAKPVTPDKPKVSESGKNTGTTESTSGVKPQTEPVVTTTTETKLAEQTKPQVAVPKKMAKIRYQVPPISKSMQLKIEITDQSGSRVLKDIQANGGEYISIDTAYTGNAGVSVTLGGELVWQERYQ